MVDSAHCRARVSGRKHQEEASEVSLVEEQGRTWCSLEIVRAVEVIALPGVDEVRFSARAGEMKQFRKKKQGRG